MAAVAGYSGALIFPSGTSVAVVNDLLSNPSADGITWLETVAAHRYWDNTVVPVIQAELDEVQTVSITGSPTGGTFTLTFGANTTAAIAYNATAAAVQTALQALASIGSGNAVCTGGPLPATAITVEFTGTLGFANQATMTFASSLTGGASPTPVITVGQNGQPYTAVSAANYTVQSIGGGIVLNAPYLGASINIRAHSANYLPWAVLANITQWAFDGQRTFQDNTALSGDGLGGAGSPWKTFQPLQLEGTFAVTKWWVPESSIGFAADVTAGTLFIISGVEMSGNRYEGYCYAKKASIKSDIAKLTEESLDFQLSGQYYLV